MVTVVAGLACGSWPLRRGGRHRRHGLTPSLARRDVGELEGLPFARECSGRPRATVSAAPEKSAVFQLILVGSMWGKLKSSIKNDVKSTAYFLLSNPLGSTTSLYQIIPRLPENH